MKLKLFFTFFLLSFVCKGQKEEVLQLFDRYNEVYSSDYVLALDLMKKAYQKSKLIKNDSLIAKSSVNIGSTLLNLKKYNEARTYCKNAIIISKKVKYFRVLAASYNTLGLIELECNNFNECLNSYLNGIKIAESHKEYDFLSILYGNIAQLYEIHKNKKKALSYYLLNLELSLKLKDDVLLNQSYSNLGAFYLESKKAENYLLKAAEYSEKLKHPLLQFSSEINLAVYYMENNNSKTIKHLEKASEIALETQDTTMLFYLHYNYGGYHRAKKEYNKALYYYDITHQYMTNVIPLNKQIDFYEGYTTIYEDLKNYEKAHFYNEKHHKLKDSLFSLEHKKQFETIQTVYEVEKKDNKIKQITKQKEIETKNKWLIFWISFSIILIGLIIFFIYYFKKKNQALKAHQEKLNLIKDKELEHIKGVLEGTNVERNRLAKELHDNVAHSLLISACTKIYNHLFINTLMLKTFLNLFE